LPSITEQQVSLASFPGSSPAFCRILYKKWGKRAWTPFIPHSTQLFADPSLGVFTPGPQFLSLGATPWGFPPRLPGALLLWWQSSYVSHGNQTVQQFVNSPVPVSPHRPVSHTFRVRFIEGNVIVCYGCRNKYPKKAETSS